MCGVRKDDSQSTSSILEASFTTLAAETPVQKTAMEEVSMLLQLLLVGVLQQDNAVFDDLWWSSVTRRSRESLITKDPRKFRIQIRISVEKAPGYDRVFRVAAGAEKRCAMVLCIHVSHMYATDNNRRLLESYAYSRSSR